MFYWSDCIFLLSAVFVDTSYDDLKSVGSGFQTIVTRNMKYAMTPEVSLELARWDRLVLAAGWRKQEF